MHTRDCVYDYSLMTERNAAIFCMKMLKAKTSDERRVLYNEVRRISAARARERGISTADWCGLSVAPRPAADQTVPMRPAFEIE